MSTERYLLKVEKIGYYDLYVTNTISKLYRQIKKSCDTLEIGVTKKEIGTHKTLWNKVKKLDKTNVLEINIKDIQFTIVLVQEIPMLREYSDSKEPKPLKTETKITKGTII